MKRKIFLTVFLAILITVPLLSFARGGGGGSSGGGGGGGGGGSHGGSGSSSSCNSTISCAISILTFLFFVLITILIYVKKIKAKIANGNKVAASIDVMGKTDPAWNDDKLKQIAIDTFHKFQKAWGDMDTKTLSEILEPEMYKRIALELSVLNNEKRRNPTTNIKILTSYFVSATDDQDNSKDAFSFSFMAMADDKLIEVETQKVLYRDSSIFNETWDFIRSGDSWKLKAIHQATEDANSLIPEISEFAAKNNFYYNPDFGWLMLPNKGVLFKDSKFGKTDINNHVIGYYREKIVEFYTMAVWHGQNSTNYLIAQAILPIEYKDILIRRKHFMNFFGPSGLRKHELESNDFINEDDFIDLSRARNSLGDIGNELDRILND